MGTTIDLHVLRVFCDEHGGAGNPLGIFPDGRLVPNTRRQAIAKHLGFSETVFIDDKDAGTLAIFTPTRELGFAGHPLVGAAWLLGHDNHGLSALRPRAGEVRVQLEPESSWVHARAEYSPSWECIQLQNPDSVLELTGPPERLGHVQAWAWLDEPAGLVRARVFASDYGIAEDPATGSAAIVLCAQLGRELRITQGPAGSESEIRVRPLAGDWVALGGRVRAEGGVRGYEV
jgi:predicted PhzF superfamily epimerase YddE/YHI9